MKDPAFLFYPGDYLRDTQCLSEKAQVAYDRIMCEHMRNICISQTQLNFFTKRLSDDEKNELMFLLTENKGGFQIEWVAESIIKRREYSENRRENRIKGLNKKSKSYDKHMLSHDKHMENEIENEIVIKDKSKKGNHLFKNSEYYNFDFFYKSIDEKYKIYDLKYYHESALNWSESKGAMYKDWLATIRNFILRDIKDGKAKMNNDSSNSNKYFDEETQRWRPKLAI